MTKVLPVNVLSRIVICVIGNFNLIMLWSDIFYENSNWLIFLKYVIIRYIYDTGRNLIEP